MVKNIKGQGHLEIILSFIIFLGFLVFVFIFLNPFAKSERVSYIGDFQDAFIEEISSEVGMLSVVETNVGDCPVVLGYGNNYIIVGSSPKYTVYYGDGFPVGSNTFDCSTDYTLGVFSKEEMIIYEKIGILKTEYETIYDELKTRLGGRGFSFSVRGMDGLEIGMLNPANPKTPPAGVNVESRDIPLRVINNNGVINEYILNIRVW